MGLAGGLLVAVPSTTFSCCSRNLVLVEKAQTLAFTYVQNWEWEVADVEYRTSSAWQTWSTTFATGLQRRVVAVEEALDLEDGVVTAPSRVEQAPRGIPRGAVDRVGGEIRDDRRLGAVQFHAP